MFYSPGPASVNRRRLKGSLCTAPPGPGGSLCRGKGAGVWHWTQRSWTAAGPSAQNIPSFPPVPLETRGSSPLPAIRSERRAYKNEEPDSGHMR